MARLPQPGGDDGNWGTILNEFLGQVHNTDGTLKPNIVDSAALAPNAVNETVLGATGGSDGQVLVKDSVSTTGLSWQTPVSGTVADASSSTKGIVQLTGDLGGTSTSPTVPGLAAKADASAVYTKGQVDTALSAKADTTALSNYVATSQKGAANGVATLDATGKVPSGQLPASGGAVTSVATRTGDVVLTKSDVGLGNVDNTSDANKPISSATQTALNGKSSTAHTHTLDSLSDVTASGATDGQSLVYNSGSWGPADVGTGGTVVDATGSVKGVVQLAGDLGGTAAVPVVQGIQGTAVSATAPSNGQVLTYTGSQAAWTAPTGASGTNVVPRTTNYTAADGDFILGNSTAGAFTVTLPTLASGAHVSVKKVDASTNAVNISGTIDNLSSDAISTQWASQDYISDGTQWYRV